MRIRTAKFVMIPMWVITHPDVRGDATRIAVYAGLRAVAWEAPDTDWRSLREIAGAVGDVIGMSSETIRKHLSVLEHLGAFVKTGDDDLLIPDDDPELGRTVGRQGPTVGSLETQTADHTSTSRKRDERDTRVGRGRPPSNMEHDDFGRFWDQYPRKKDRPVAIRAFNAAIDSGATVDDIVAGLEAELRGWEATGRHLTKIPYPATWLNARGWENEPDRPASKADPIAAAVAAGRPQDAWRMVLDEAGRRERYRWWPDADRYAAAGRSAQVIAAAVGVHVDDAAGFLRLRARVLSGDTPIGLSQLVLPSPDEEETR